MLDEQVKEDRYRNFLILLYDKSKFYNLDEVLFTLKGFKYYAYIKHKPEQEEKQAHYHVFLHLDNACTLQALSKRLGVPKNYFQAVKSVRSSCRYLTHIDYDDKIQYNLDEVIVSKLFERKFKKNFEDIKTEEEIILNIYAFIDNLQIETYNKALMYLVIYINKNCYDTIFRRYRGEFLDYLRSQY